MSAVSQKAVIFDMGGVILRTEDPSSRIKLATKYGISHDDLVKKVFMDDLAKKATIGDITEEHYWQEIGKKMAISADEMESFQRNFWAGDRVDQELVDFIKNINSILIYPF